MDYIKNWTKNQWLGVILLAIVIVLWPSLFGDWLDWDDVNYVLRNQLISGSDGMDILRIFSTPEINGQYTPVTFIVYGLLYSLSGTEPFGYHLFGLFLHIINAGLVFLLVRKWSSDNTLSGIVALLFGLSPVHVESVAWIASLKDLLSGFFALLATLMILEWSTIKGTLVVNSRSYWLSLFLFCLALLSKGTIILLPLVFYLILIQDKRKSKLKAFLPILPFLVISLVLGYKHWMAQQLGGALSPFEEFDLLREMIIGMHNLGHYFIHAFLPVNLSPFHPYPAGISESFSGGFLLISGLGLASVIGLLYLAVRESKYRWPLAIYFLMLLPVLQFVPFGLAIVAERFTYLAYCGLWMIGIHLLLSVISKAHQSRVLWGLLLYLFVMAIVSFNYAHSWKNAENFWQATLASYPEDAFVLTNLGNEAAKGGNIDLAINYYDEAIERDGGLIEAINNRGLIYWETGRDSLAIIDFQRVIVLDPTFVNAIINSGLIWMNNDFNTLAMNAFNRAIQMDDANPIAYYNRGILFSKLGLIEKAIADMTSSIELMPNEAEFYRKRSSYYLNINDTDKAISDLRSILNYDREDRRAAFLLDSLIGN